MPRLPLPVVLVGMVLADAGPAAAHGLAPIVPGDALTHWNPDPLVLGPLLLLHGLYGRGLFDLRRRLGRLAPAFPPWRIAAFVAGELALLLALVSPLDALAGTLLSAHMAQHVLLIAVAPPLLVLGRPGIACLQGLPARARRGFARHRVARGLRKLLAFASRPLAAAFLHGAVLWVWHAPALFDAAGAGAGLHWLEHACFLGSAILFWRGLIDAAGSARSAAVGAAASLATLVHGGFLSALITLSPVVLYPAATRWAPLWGLTPLEDQQLAGTIMWVPAGGAYLAAGLILMAHLLAPGAEPSRPLQVAGAKPSQAG